MIRVESSQGSYPVLFTGPQPLEGLGDDVLLVTDAHLAELYALPDVPTLVLPPGEQTKSLEYLGRILSWLATQRASRKSRLIAFGGGVIGDLAGFAAAVYMRGIRYVQVPTSLLAQVDSSVGGKVAVDLPEGKNLAGAFHPPSEVRIAVSYLDTLPDRQIRNGMAEVWKYVFILDPDLGDLLVEPERDWESIVRRCITLKAGVVAEDEFETKGLRATLNYGHTVGHALEALMGYEGLLHGEAISVGMVAEALLGERLGVTRAGTTEYVRESLEREGLPITHPALSRADDLLDLMRRDKKAEGGRLAFSLLTAPGRCTLVEGVEENEVRGALREV
jgi:3-dehydroquinate synthase